MTTKADFIQLVMRIMNEANAGIDGAEMVGSDMTRVDEYIEQLFPAAWRRALGMFPRYWMAGKSMLDAAVKHDGPAGTGYIILPDDYAELMSLKMKQWKTALTELLDDSPANNKKQENIFARGTARRPEGMVKMVTDNNTLKKALYYYSLPTTYYDTQPTVLSDLAESAIYIPHVTTLGDTVPVMDIAITPLAYLTAAVVYRSMEKETMAKAMEAMVVSG
jgi:hypothetical protein